MWRCQAWAIFDYRVHGGHLQINSGMRTDYVINKYRGKGLRPNYRSQRELFDRWTDALRRWGRAGAIARGFFPANPPGVSSHEGRSDGIPFYGVPRGAKIARYKYGLDVVDAPGGSAYRFVTWLNRNKYKAVRPYAVSSERHHMNFSASPATRARVRLARWVATGR